MYFDLFLLSVIAVTGYLGPMILRRQPPGQRAFGWLLVADGVCALVALAGRKTEGPGGLADLLGAIAMGAAMFLVVIPPILRDLARRALRADRPAIALRLIDLWDLLQPGMGADRERELVEMLAAVRAGQVDEAIAVLRETRDRLSDPVARRHMDERIVATYLSARRWREAIDTYEVSLAQPMTSPQLAVEMVWAYGEAGNLAAAGQIVTRLEQTFPADEPVFAFLINRARLMFLAFAGRASAVEGIVAANGPLGMLPEPSRWFWSGMARLHAGDRAGARTALEQAARLSRQDRRARSFAERLIARIDEPGVAGPRELGPELAELADRCSAAAASSKRPVIQVVPRLSQVSWREVPVTTALALANLVVFGAVWWLFGSTGDPGALVRVGANVKSWVLAGEWWRLASSLFLHVGGLHLCLNVYGLWSLGKLVEQMYGPVRLFAVYMAAGLAGALASALFGGPGISAGASGAVFGLLGTLIAELALHRRAYPSRWRNMLLGPLLFVAAAQVGIGFFYPAIDQLAHVGGLAAGGLGAVLLSRKSSLGMSAAVRVLAAVLAVAGAGSVAYAVHGVATTRYGEMLRAGGMTEHQISGLVSGLVSGQPSNLVLTGPASWRATEGGLVDDMELVSMFFEVQPVCGPGDAPGAGRCVPASDLGAHLDAAIEQTARSLEAGTHVIADGRLALPAPWESRELSVTRTGLGGKEHDRLVVFGRVHESELWVGFLRVPEVLAAELEPTLAALLQSVRRAPAEPRGR